MNLGGIMNFNKLYNDKNILGVSGLFSAYGSFGVIDGEESASYKITKSKNKTTYVYQTDKVKLTSTFIKEKDVIVRKDYFENISKEDIVINKLTSRFIGAGGAYNVYTQYNGWQRESKGAWNTLNTEITASSNGIRSLDGSAPIMAIENAYNKRITVFHLLVNCQWKMSVKKIPQALVDMVVIETGFNDGFLALKVKPKEVINLPEIIFYCAENKTDLDCYKLHEYINEKFPRKNLPILYNSWLYCFDDLNVDNLLKQVDTASELGFEGFMIDAGWFGNGQDWFSSVGDWEENFLSGTKGRLKELSDKVIQKGMIFGLWFEPERVSLESKTYKAHPEFFNGCFLNYADENARNYMLEKVCKKIEEYNVGWIKLDFNDTTSLDKTGADFYHFYKGQEEFIKQIKNRFPNIYITICGGGGYMMELGALKLGDTFWFTDNQGAYDGIEIIKNSLKRLPSCVMERWSALKCYEDFPVYQDKPRARLISSNNATWDFIVGINDEFTEEFAKGGAMGFSCDINGFNKNYKKRWAEIIKEYKTDREFFRTALAKILVDAENVIAIEYFDKDLKEIYIQVFTKSAKTDTLTIYPKMLSKNYEMGDRIINGKVVKENGLTLENLKPNSCKAIKLKIKGE